MGGLVSDHSTGIMGFNGLNRANCGASRIGKRRATTWFNAHPHRLVTQLKARALQLQVT